MKRSNLESQLAHLRARRDRARQALREHTSTCDACQVGEDGEPGDCSERKRLSKTWGDVDDAYEYAIREG